MSQFTDLRIARHLTKRSTGLQFLAALVYTRDLPAAVITTLLDLMRQHGLNITLLEGDELVRSSQSLRSILEARVTPGGVIVLQNWERNRTEVTTILQRSCNDLPNDRALLILSDLDARKYAEFRRNANAFFSRACWTQTGSWTRYPIVASRQVAETAISLRFTLSATAEKGHKGHQ